ncbi:TetR/AcrR family transcriptional regulator [Williamsia phyllosphaerae]|uniref:Transcriptional regulator n=1 Tax=Williamsia phyllosphaerae TaxID=885042 RepID=A0ABQ1U5B3_9NOCA|nr:TetR/AcrR family transcriptional regulator [Williamsia phyllosphaerae]GGF08750.1 transcriptional regulator [Williamsia phyllosphaerae]
MATTTTRQAYLETGLDVLADLGYGGLKLAEVCRRLGVTSGSFYHFFDNWGHYTGELLEHWRTERSAALIEHVRAEPDPRKRIEALRAIGMSLPYRAESAIRTWSSLDPAVLAVQQEVDAQRVQVLHDAAFAIVGNERGAEMFAKWSMYLLVGYEQITLQADRDALEWMFNRAEIALDSGELADLPPV